MIPDRRLSDHFSLYELTVTQNAALQEANRDLTDEQVAKLTQLARNENPLQGLEAVRAVVGLPVRVHSAYRAPTLNGATRGASPTSQHPRCEAGDLDVPGQSVDETFRFLLQAAQSGKLRFGQLIIEEADRGYKNADGTESVARWVHYSIVGTLDPEKVGQAMTAKWDDGLGKMVYTLVAKLDFARA